MAFINIARGTRKGIYKCSSGNEISEHLEICKKSVKTNDRDDYAT